MYFLIPYLKLLNHEFNIIVIQLVKYNSKHFFFFFLSDNFDYFKRL